MKLRPVRGTHDLYGNNIKKYNNIFETVSEFAKLFSFSEIQTPIFEFSNLFLKPLGEQSDVVLKEMYTFKDRNDELLTLRPEYTTPMIRSALTNNLMDDLPLKVYGIGPMFRRERPQKGRYRQFNQINFEVFGSNNFMVDLELIILAYEILKKLLPSKNLILNLNSLGTSQNLIDYKDKLKKFFNDNKSKLSQESYEKINSNPLRILDSKQETDIALSNKAPSINEFLSIETKNHFEELKRGLEYHNIKYTENHKLVRGLDYYCSTVFEFKTNNLGSQDTILGGGRYDGLIKTLGGPDIPGIGWAAGIERISMLMNNIKDNSKILHIAINDEKFKNHLLKLIKNLKENNIKFYWNYKYNLKKSLQKANREKITNIIIIGENEYNNDFYTLKKLDKGNQFEIKLNDLNKYLND